MGRLLLIVAVLGTVTSLWGVVLGAENIPQENEKYVVFCEGRGNLTIWLTKDDDTCPQYSGNAVKCGRGQPACKFCCELGQDCVGGFMCQCSLTPGQNCDSMCRNNPGHFPCCADGSCHCCLDNQLCDTDEGCTCDLDFCGKYCAGQEGPATTPCCQDGKLCQCCGSSDICTDKGCSPSCKTTCKGDGKGGIPCCKGEECQICDPNMHECSLTNGCQPKEVCESDQTCDSWCKGQGVGGGCCSQTQRFNPGLCSCCYRGETCGPKVVPSSPAPKLLQNVSLKWDEDEDTNLAFDLDTNRGWGWGTAAGNGWGRCNCDRSLCEAHCGQYGSKGCCTRLPVRGDLHDFCVCCGNGVNCNQDAKRCECDPNECQKQCKGTCDPSTATCKSNCASNEVCKNGQCQSKCDESCTSANCKSCQNDVCVTSCPPEQCNGWTCTTSCNQANCGATCDGTCNPATNQCESGCPGTCVSGKCPCDPAKCKLQQPCGICSGGNCVPSQCPSGTVCNPSSGNCECDKTTCQGTCAQGTTACCKNIGTCTCCNQWQTCGPTGRGGFWGLMRYSSSWDCVCDSSKCLASECKQCDPQTQQCVSTCAKGQSCTGGKCVSLCNGVDCSVGCPPGIGCCVNGNCVCCATGCTCNTVTGICDLSNSCDGVTCPTGEKCVGGVCQCDAKICGLNNLCEACGSTGHCGPIECGDCAICDPQKGCQFQCDRATQTCVNGVCKCNPANCGQTCNGQCNSQTQLCDSGCPGQCVGWTCPQCDGPTCAQSCNGVCSGGKCQPNCPQGQICFNNACQSGSGWPSAEVQCGSNKCSTSNCQQCGKDGMTCESTCTGSQTCQNGVCVDKCQGVTCSSLGEKCVDGNCVCDATLCSQGNRCIGCGLDNVCRPIECGACDYCDVDIGCLSSCDPATQNCVSGTCTDKCVGVTCPTGDKCVGGVCQCDAAVCGVGNACQFCGPSQTCEPWKCAEGLSCDSKDGQCVCTDSSCAAKCYGQGAPCCSSDLKDCVCCPSGWSCGAIAVIYHELRDFSKGNSSSVERAGVCTDPSAAVQCDSETCSASNCKQCGQDGTCQSTCTGSQTCVDGKCSSVCMIVEDCNAECDAFNGYSGPDPPKGASTGCCVSGNCVCCPPGTLCYLGVCHHL